MRTCRRHPVAARSHLVVTFPLLAKVSVKSDDIHPLYAYLTTKSPKPGEIVWNFTKFLVGRDS